uniref:Uncharacterized protein n=1 Tax=Noccaea caerulescens TaxID=107243 RepID=A0A1J3GBJ1_NOCCA
MSSSNKTNLIFFKRVCISVALCLLSFLFHFSPRRPSFFEFVGNFVNESQVVYVVDFPCNHQSSEVEKATTSMIETLHNLKLNAE